MLNFKDFNISESNIEYIEQKYKNFEPAHDIDGKNKQPHKIVNHFASNADPSEDKKYTGWIMDKYKKQHFGQEEHPRILNILSQFEQNKNHMKDKDINKYESLEHLESAIRHSEFSKPEFKDDKIVKYLNSPNKSIDDKYVLMHHPKVKKDHLLQIVNNPNQNQYMKKLAIKRLNDIGALPVTENVNTQNTKYRDLNFFIQFAAKELKIIKLPTIKFVGKEEDVKRAFGHFFSGINKTEIRVRVIERHPIDIMRTIAHELSHWKQFQDKVHSSETAKEDYANAMAGRIMRKFDTKYPNMFKKRAIHEEGEGAIGTGTGEVPVNNTSGVAKFDPLLLTRKKLDSKKLRKILGNKE